jgi:phosphoglycolate phosphatase-like HAD superfamily hydrolase
MRVRVIFFDMDGTLVWVPGGGQADWIAEKLKDAGIEPDGGASGASVQAGAGALAI